MAPDGTCSAPRREALDSPSHTCPRAAHPCDPQALCFRLGAARARLCRSSTAPPLSAPPRPSLNTLSTICSGSSAVADRVQVSRSRGHHGDGDGRPLAVLAHGGQRLLPTWPRVTDDTLEAVHEWRRLRASVLKVRVGRLGPPCGVHLVAEQRLDHAQLVLDPKVARVVEGGRRVAGWACHLWPSA